MLTGWRAGVLGVVSAAVLAGSWLGATSALGAPAHLPRHAVLFKTEHIARVHGVVLAENNGQVVYTFTGDRRGHAGTCTGACAAIWPPVRGVGVLAHGVKIGGKFGRINGQITYNGWPLYLFTGAKPKQNNANSQFKVVKPTPWHSSPRPAPSPTPPSPGPTPTNTYMY
jgi:predicted lipoprotein with Yx(FWY)xxD motif